MERRTRIWLSAAATSLALIPFEVTAPAAAADARAPEEGTAPVAQRAPERPRRLIERPPSVDPIEEPLEFGFALFDWVLGG